MSSTAVLSPHCCRVPCPQLMRRDDTHALTTRAPPRRHRVHVNPPPPPAVTTHDSTTPATTLAHIHPPASPTHATITLKPCSSAFARPPARAKQGSPPPRLRGLLERYIRRHTRPPRWPLSGCTSPPPVERLEKKLVSGCRWTSPFPLSESAVSMALAGTRSAQCCTR